MTDKDIPSNHTIIADLYEMTNIIRNRHLRAMAEEQKPYFDKIAELQGKTVYDSGMVSSDDNGNLIINSRIYTRMI